MAASETRSVSLRRCRGRRARPAEEGDAEGPDEAGGGQARADSASMAPTAGTISFRPHCGSSGLSRIAWKVSHSETKPLSGGSAEMAMQPAKKANAVSGMRWMRPPSFSMSRSPVAVSTAPAPKNSRLLNSEWLRTCNSAAVSASAAGAVHAVAP